MPSEELTLCVALYAAHNEYLSQMLCMVKEWCIICSLCSLHHLRAYET